MDENLPELTHWAIRKMINFEIVDKPVLRLTDYQQASQEDPQSMFVLELSDGDSSYDNCVVHSPQLIQRLREGEFEKPSVVVLNDYYFHKQVHFLYVKDMSLVKTVNQTDSQSNLESLIIPFTVSADTQQQPDLSTPSVEEQQNPQINEEVEVVSNQRPVTTDSSSVDRPSLGASDVQPINTITTNQSNSWAIRGRITSKGKKRRWDNHNGSGSVTSFVITDQSGDIRLNAFNRLCDKYYHLIEENKIYRISEGTVKMADKRFSNLSNDYEITLTSDSKVVECPPEEAFCVRVCKPRYRFVAIRDLYAKPIGSVVDVIGAVQEVGHCYRIASKQAANKSIAKRDITLVDNTDTDISFTLWKENAEQFECKEKAIIAVQSAVLKDFGGRSLSSYPNTNIKIEPDIPEAQPIREWLSNRQQQNASNDSLMTEVSEIGGRQSNTCLTPVNNSSVGQARSAGRIKLALLDQITEQSIGVQKQSIYYVRARVSFPVNRSPLYKSCRRSRCFKKLMELPNGLYRCSKCVEETPHFQWRLYLAAVLIDCTEERWIGLFDAEAARLIGCTAQQLSQYTDQEQYEKVLHSIEYKSYLWKIGAKLQTYLNQTDVKLNVLDFWPKDPIKDSIEMIKSIQKLTQNN